MFMTYWFVVFVGVFFPVFWFCNNPTFRKYWLLFACAVFYYRFAGPAGVIPIFFLGVMTYLSGRSAHRNFRLLTIVLCALALIFYKYTTFIIVQVIGLVDVSFSQEVLAKAQHGIIPEAPPLAISFFVFEFVHYLVDIQKGKQAIKSVLDFSLFSMFWPSVVSGPIKRFDQFIPKLGAGSRGISLHDIQIGTMRIIMGLVKKNLIADNLTSYIDYWQPDFASLNYEQRWLLVFTISMRILFDFSGYTDMAIGFARLMGITLPENFNWPYLATNIQKFWQRWHISLSTWIRDYIYIPLGGNQHGYLRKTTNGVLAFAICGLWHGAAWNFMFWGVYHGLGLVLSNSFRSLMPKDAWLLNEGKIIVVPFAWLITFVFVSIGWLYFFYPVGEATKMLGLLVTFS